MRECAVKCIGGEEYVTLEPIRGIKYTVIRKPIRAEEGIGVSFCDIDYAKREIKMYRIDSTPITTEEYIMFIGAIIPKILSYETTYKWICNDCPMLVGEWMVHNSRFSIRRVLPASGYFANKKNKRRNR